MASCNSCGGKILPFTKTCLTCAEKLRTEMIANRPNRTPSFTSDFSDLAQTLCDGDEHVIDGCHAFSIAWYFSHKLTMQDNRVISVHVPDLQHVLLVVTNKQLRTVTLEREVVSNESGRQHSCSTSVRIVNSRPLPAVNKSGKVDFHSIGALRTDWISPSTGESDGFGNLYDWKVIPLLHGDHSGCHRYVDFDCSLNRIYCEIENRPIEFFSFNAELHEVAKQLSENLFLAQNTTITMSDSVEEKLSPTASFDSPIDATAASLQKLADLYEKGLITEDEFKEAKAKVLGL